MKKLLFVVLALFCLNSATSRAELREIVRMRQVMPAVHQNTLMVFDLDNTVFEPTQTLGTDQWFSYIVKKDEASGKSHEEAVTDAVKRWTPVQMRTAMVPVERETPSFLRFLQLKGIKVMGLTARPATLARRTIEQLGGIHVDFTQQPIYGRNTAVIGDPGSQYIRGIIFLGPNGDKGRALTAFLKQIQQNPPEVVFIDDKLRNVQSVETALATYNGIHTSFRYGFDDEKVKRFRPEIAELEWSYFLKLGRLLTDEEAQRIINGN